MRISDWSSDVCSSDLFSLAPLLIARVAPINAGMSNGNDGTTVRRSPRGLRHFFHQISLMANSPWGNGPKDGDDGKRPGPRNPWVKIGRASCRERVCQSV